MPKACLSCGARLSDDDLRCELCGTPAPGTTPEQLDPVAEQRPGVPAAASVTPAEPATPPPGREDAPLAAPAAPKAERSGAVFCNQCGWKNPEDARFCSQCGAPLQAAKSGDAAPPPAASSSPASETQSPQPASDAASSAGDASGATWRRLAEVGHGEAGPHLAPTAVAGAAVSPAAVDQYSDAALGKRVGIVVGAGILLVIALFMITALAKRGGNAGSAAPASAPAPASTSMPSAASPAQPLTPQFQSRADDLNGQIEDAQGDERVALQRQLSDVYVSAGRYDLATGVTEAIAAATGTEADWQLAGNMAYDWMELVPGSPDQTVFAKRAIASYKKVLELNDDNLDVRTDMAVAYMYDPDNPMLAIQETAEVLKRDSLHIQANFNRAVMLMQINRMDGALAQFQKVQRLVGDPNDLVYQRAEEAIQNLRSMR
jgi:tetratricopeptide (TPR) repeat protein